MAIGIITGSGTYALPGFEGGGPEPVDTRCDVPNERGHRETSTDEPQGAQA